MLIVLARAPSAPGKTRLTSNLTHEHARALREALFLDTLDIARLAGVPVCVRYTPSDAREEIASLVGDITHAPQSAGDLGARMQQAAASGFASGAKHVVLLGSDLPTLPPSRVTDAFARLDAGADCVFGPSDDGGYYLLGLAQARGQGADDTAARFGPLFAGIEWGTERVLQESLAAAAAARLGAEVIAPWYDVDDPDDLARVLADGQGARRTRAWSRAFAAGPARIVSDTDRA